MAVESFLVDDQFDALVDRLHGMISSPRSESVDRWEIRVALAEHGVLPTRVAAPPSPSIEDSLAASLKAVLRELQPRRHAQAA